MRRVLVGTCLVLIVAACGGNRPLSLSEYATQGGAMSAVMEQRIATMDAELSSPTVSPEEARAYWAARLQARVELLEELRTLDPPDALADMHWGGLDLFDKLISAEETLAAHVASIDTATEPEQWWDTAEGKAVRVVDSEILELCRVFQARYDATIDRTGLSEMPWIPTEMKEIVQIDVGCE